MTSRLKQARLLFQSIPLSGTTKEALVSRCESNLSAVEVWAKNGNSKAVQQAGSGRLAICAWIAAKTLADDARIESFQRASGLSPRDFAASEKVFTEAIQRTRSSASNPSTPRRNGIYRNFEPSSSSSQPSPKSQEETPEAKSRRIRDVMSGAAFATNNRSPLAKRRDADEASVPSTPTTQRTLRDRSSIKEVHIYDPSKYDTTPTKKSVVFDPASNNKSQKRPLQVTEEDAASPSKHRHVTVKRRHKILVGYPAGEPLRKGRFELMGEWDSIHANDRVKKCIEALDHCQDQSGWRVGEAMAQVQLSL